MAQNLLDKINYHKSMESSTNAIVSLQKVNPRLNEDNILTLAYLMSSPAISKEEKEIYEKCLHAKAQMVYERYKLAVDEIDERKRQRELEEQGALPPYDPPIANRNCK